MKQKKDFGKVRYTETPQKQRRFACNPTEIQNLSLCGITQYTRKVAMNSSDFAAFSQDEKGFWFASDCGMFWPPVPVKNANVALKLFSAMYGVKMIEIMPTNDKNVIAYVDEEGRSNGLHVPNPAFRADLVGPLLFVRANDDGTDGELSWSEVVHALRTTHHSCGWPLTENEKKRHASLAASISAFAADEKTFRLIPDNIWRALWSDDACVEEKGKEEKDTAQDEEKEDEEKENEEKETRKEKEPLEDGEIVENDDENAENADDDEKKGKTQQTSQNRLKRVFDNNVDEHADEKKEKYESKKKCNKKRKIWRHADSDAETEDGEVKSTDDAEQKDAEQKPKKGENGEQKNTNHDDDDDNDVADVKKTADCKSWFWAPLVYRGRSVAIMTAKIAAIAKKSSKNNDDDVDDKKVDGDAADAEHDFHFYKRGALVRRERIVDPRLPYSSTSTNLIDTVSLTFLTVENERQVPESIAHFARDGTLVRAQANCFGFGCQETDASYFIGVVKDNAKYAQFVFHQL